MIDTPPASRLDVSQVDDDSCLLCFAFDGGGDGPLSVPCRRLAGFETSEAWFAGEVSESAITQGAAWAHGEHYAMAAVSVAEDGADIESAAAAAYQRLIACIRPSAHPYLLRIWNYFSAINDGEGDDERYRRFCVGRAEGADGAFGEPPPAATAIGASAPTGRIQLIALCGRAPATALENPRQTPAWNYPRQFGPVAPGFSRGVLLDAGGETPRLLASGTASIVGHVSRHVGDIEAQLRETLANLDALLAEAAAKCGRTFPLTACQSLRVYLRREADLPGARRLIEDAGIPPERTVYLQGDVCRRELDVEIEGVFAAR